MKSEKNISCLSPCFLDSVFECWIFLLYSNHIRSVCQEDTLSETQTNEQLFVWAKLLHQKVLLVTPPEPIEVSEINGGLGAEELEKLKASRPTGREPNSSFNPYARGLGTQTPNGISSCMEGGSNRKSCVACATCKLKQNTTFARTCDGEWVNWKPALCHALSPSFPSWTLSLSLLLWACSINGSIIRFNKGKGVHLGEPGCRYTSFIAMKQEAIHSARAR